MSRSTASKKPSLAVEGRGRPLSFDRDCALDTAMRVFWERGYEGTSMQDLKDAMDLSVSSIYSAFTDKAHLYSEAVDRYATTVGGFSTPILDNADEGKPTMERLLLTFARELTRNDQPKGCMVAISLMHGGLGAKSMQEEMAKRRSGGVGRLQDLIQKDLDEGRLPKDVKAADLASFYAVVIQGMTARARDGASRAKLEAIARIAMKAWPAS